MYILTPTGQKISLYLGELSLKTERAGKTFILWSGEILLAEIGCFPKFKGLSVLYKSFSDGLTKFPNGVQYPCSRAEPVAYPRHYTFLSATVREDLPLQTQQNPDLVHTGTQLGVNGDFSPGNSCAGWKYPGLAAMIAHIFAYMCSEASTSCWPTCRCLSPSQPAGSSTRASAAAQRLAGPRGWN